MKLSYIYYYRQHLETPPPSAADVICERSLKGNNIFLLFVILNGSLILRYSMSKTLTISVGERSHMVSARFWQILPPLPLSATVSIERPPLMTSAFARSPPFQSDISFSKNPLHSTLIETLNVYLISSLKLKVVVSLGEYINAVVSRIVIGTLNLKQ